MVQGSGEHLSIHYHRLGGRNESKQIGCGEIDGNKIIRLRVFSQIEEKIIEAVIYVGAAAADLQALITQCEVVLRIRVFHHAVLAWLLEAKLMLRVAGDECRNRIAVSIFFQDHGKWALQDYLENGRILRVLTVIVLVSFLGLWTTTKNSRCGN